MNSVEETGCVIVVVRITVSVSANAGMTAQPKMLTENAASSTFAFISPSPLVLQSGCFPVFVCPTNFGALAKTGKTVLGSNLFDRFRRIYVFGVLLLSLIHI